MDIYIVVISFFVVSYKFQAVLTMATKSLIVMAVACALVAVVYGELLCSCAVEWLDREKIGCFCFGVFERFW